MLHKLGDASYSIYLFHLFAVGAGWAIAHRLWPAEPQAVYFAIAFATASMALAVGLIAHHLFERPLLNLCKPRKRETLPDAALATSPA